MEPDVRAKLDDYLNRLGKTGYFDAKGNPLPEHRVQDADMVAQMFADAGVTAGQLRKFFTMARSLEQQLDVHGNFATLVPELVRLQPIVAVLIGLVVLAGIPLAILRRRQSHGEAEEETEV